VTYRILRLGTPCRKGSSSVGDRHRLSVYRTGSNHTIRCSCGR